MERRRASEVNWRGVDSSLLHNPSHLSMSGPDTPRRATTGDAPTVEGRCAKREAGEQVLDSSRGIRRAG